MFVLANVERDFDMPHPIRIMAWILLFGYTLKSLYLSYAVIVDAPFRSDFLSRDIILLGQAAIVLGFISFAIGYIMARGNTQSVESTVQKKYNIRLDPRIFYYSIFAICLSLMVIYFQKMGFIHQILNLKFSTSKFFIQEDTGLKSSLGFLTMGAYVLIAYFLYSFVFRKKFSFFDICFLSLLFVAICFFLAGKRNGIMIIIILVLMLGRIEKINIRNKSGLRNIKRWFTIGLILFILSFASQIRKGGGEKTLTELEIQSALAVSIEHVMEGAYFLDPAKTAAIVSHVNENNSYFLGSSFFNFILTPIPRILWPEKPNIRLGPYVGQEILLFNNQSGAPPGGIGELYINFGWPGVILGMALLGAIVARLWRRYIAAVDRRFQKISLALYMAAIMLFLVVEFSSAVIALIKFQLGIIVCERYWRWRIRRESLEETRRIASLRQFQEENYSVKYKERHSPIW